MDKIKFYPAHDYYIVRFWEDAQGRHWQPLRASEDLDAAIERVRHTEHGFVVPVAWLGNVTHFLPFVAHDGEKWRWVNAEGLDADQLTAAVITAAVKISAEFDRALSARPGHQGLVLEIGPFWLKDQFLPGDTGKELGVLIR